MNKPKRSEQPQTKKKVTEHHEQKETLRIERNKHYEAPAMKPTVGDEPTVVEDDKPTTTAEE
jgi:hypothetical protein